jgi:hypothetical protein
VPYFLAALAICVLALVHLWLLGAREAHLVRSVSIGAPAPTVFDLIGQIDRLPEWRLTRTSLPRALWLSELSSWGEQVPAADRACPNKGGGNDQVQFRSIKNRESGYRHASRALRYESVFRLTPFSHRPGCHLVWDVRYRLLRPVDAIMSPWVAAQETGAGMEVSLQAIRRVAESVAERPTWQKPRAFQAGAG